MPGLETAVLEAAKEAGLPLALGSKAPWLSGRGHLHPVVLDAAPEHALRALAQIHEALGGDPVALASKRPGNPPTPDLVHVPTGCIIEIDEVQHFTTARLCSLDFYPSGVRLGYDLDEYKRLIEEWRAKGDRAYAHKVAVDFPNKGGRQAQRAYNDALRDLLAPTFTAHPVLRIPVPNRDLNGCVDELLRVLPITL